jgi:hypothetical protein
MVLIIVEPEECWSLCGNLVRTVAILHPVERRRRLFLIEMRGNQGMSRELVYAGAMASRLLCCLWPIVGNRPRAHQAPYQGG